MPTYKINVMVPSVALVDAYTLDEATRIAKGMVMQAQTKNEDKHCAPFLHSIYQQGPVIVPFDPADPPSAA